MLAEKRRVTALVERAIADAPVADWLDRFGAAGVPAGPVLSRETVHADEQARANGLIQDLEQPGLGPLTMLGRVFRIDGEDRGPTRPAPALGADTDAVLAEVGA